MQSTTTTTTQLCCQLSLLLPLIALSALPHASSNSINSSGSSSSSNTNKNNNDNIETFGVRKAPLELELEQEEANGNSLNMIQRNYMIMHPAGAASAHSDAGIDHSRSLKRASLTNSSITCNDGTHAGFYLRKQPNSKKWIVFLEGGWHCFDNRSCRARWLRLRHLMTSSQWPETRDGE